MCVSLVDFDNIICRHCDNCVAILQFSHLELVHCGRRFQPVVENQRYVNMRELPKPNKRFKGNGHYIRSFILKHYCWHKNFFGNEQWGAIDNTKKKRENVLCSKVCQRKFINTIILSSPRKTIIIEFLFDNPCSSFLQYDYEKCPLNVPEQNCIFCYPLQDVH